MLSSQDKHMIGHGVLRILIGLMFLIAGIGKLMMTSGVVAMLSNLHFPAPTFFAWILLLSEIIFGALVVVGYKVKWTAWPLVIVMAIAWIAVVIPSGDGLFKGLTSPNSFFHLITLVNLVILSMAGPGKWAMTKH